MLNLVTLCQTVWALILGAEKFRGAGPAPPPNPQNMQISDACYVGKFGRSKSNGWCIITEILRRSLTFPVSPFKVTQGHEQTQIIGYL